MESPYAHYPAQKMIHRCKLQYSLYSLVNEKVTKLNHKAKLQL